jgi:hypothetical protein
MPKGASINMSAESKFLVYCIEVYKLSKNMTGEQVMELFKRYNVMDYILSCYEALHTTGASYIIEDIDIFLEARQAS